MKIHQINILSRFLRIMFIFIHRFSYLKQINYNDSERMIKVYSYKKSQVTKTLHFGSKKIMLYYMLHSDILLCGKNEKYEYNKDLNTKTNYNWIIFHLFWFIVIRCVITNNQNSFILRKCDFPDKFIIIHTLKLKRRTIWLITLS